MLLVFVLSFGSWVMGLLDSIILLYSFSFVSSLIDKMTTSPAVSSSVSGVFIVPLLKRFSISN